MKQVLPWMSNLVAPQEHLAMALQIKNFFFLFCFLQNNHKFTETAETITDPMLGTVSKGINVS